MPLTCPHCRTALAAGDKTCGSCEWTQESDTIGPDPARVRQAPWWLRPFLAVGLLLAVSASAFFVVERGPAGHAARPPGPSAGLQSKAAGPAATPVPAAPASPPPPAPGAGLPAWVGAPVKVAAKGSLKPPRKAAPLRVVLTPSSQRRHVRVGEDVTLTALAQGRCASLTLSYRRGFGGTTTHSFTEGGLLSTTWTPAVPGRYEFTATALGGPRRAAVSRPVEITVDDPAARRVARGEAPRAFPAEVITPLPPMAVRLPPMAARLLPRPRRVKPRTEAPPVLPEPVIPAASDTPPVPSPAPAAIYHVAAAQFPFSRSAVVLAKSFRLQGSPATTKRMIGYHGRTVYAVVTGAYRRPEEARAAVLVLQRSGYPAYLYGGN